jgi:hypothetical protein
MLSKPIYHHASCIKRKVIDISSIFSNEKSAGRRGIVENVPLNPVEKCTRSFPRCYIYFNRGKVTSRRLLVTPLAAPSIIKQVLHWRNIPAEIVLNNPLFLIRFHENLASLNMLGRDQYVTPRLADVQLVTSNSTYADLDTSEKRMFDMLIDVGALFLNVTALVSLSEKAFQPITGLGSDDSPQELEALTRGSFNVQNM